MNLKPIREDRPLDYPNGYLLLPEDIKKKENGFIKSMLDIGYGYRELNKILLSPSFNNDLLYAPFSEKDFRVLAKRDGCKKYSLKNLIFQLYLLHRLNDSKNSRAEDINLLKDSIQRLRSMKDGQKQASSKATIILACLVPLGCFLFSFNESLKTIDDGIKATTDKFKEGKDKISQSTKKTIQEALEKHTESFNEKALNAGELFGLEDNK